MIDKFRAWDKKNKEWLYESNPELLTFYGFAIFGECALICTPSCSDLVNIEITQYTGLNDKNGKEIYESDVIKSGRTGLNYKVIFDEEAALFMGLCVDTKKDFCLNTYSWAENEVIGNIYENPELLENK